MTISPEFVVTLQNRQFVLFAGLLDAAHRAGLKSIITTPIQIPAEGNGFLAVMKARVEMESGQVYEAIGDASPESVGRMIIPHVLRMAETRSIGRALRWALNITATMREELGADLPPDAERSEPPHPAPVVNGADCAANECESCRQPTRLAQTVLSQRRWAKTLCPSCQRGRR